jgi:hypothetical protein
MLDCGGDGGDDERIKQSGEEIKPSLENVMVSTNLSNGRTSRLLELKIKERGGERDYNMTRKQEDDER